MQWLATLWPPDDAERLGNNFPGTKSLYLRAHIARTASLHSHDRPGPVCTTRCHCQDDSDEDAWEVLRQFHGD